LPFSAADQENLVKNVIEPMASDGLRTICVAYKNYVKGTCLTFFYSFLTTIANPVDPSVIHIFSVINLVKNS
jgi:hypothetical protein